MKKNKSFQKKVEKLLGNELPGLLVAHYGAMAEVEDANGQIIRCHLRKNAEPVITGDRVLWQPGHDGLGVIVGHLRRKSLLARPETRGKMKLIAANIDVMLIVIAPPPVFSEYLIDRYIIAAEKLKITPIIVLNKIDLLDEITRSDVLERLAVYEKIGYRVIFSSLYTKDGLTALGECFQSKTCVLVGPSGVGKSSIIATFTPDEAIRVGETSASGLGKHTTTMTRLYHLPDGGQVIDSPGVREFNLWHLNQEEILEGFVEFKPFLNSCKYRNCQHNTKELECAVQQAIEEGNISPKRLQSYLDMLQEK